MKVLFITEEFPYPLDTGGNVRTFHLLRALASQHDVVLLAMNRAGLEPAHVDAVRAVVREVQLVESADKGIARELGAVLRSASSGVPFILERHRSRPLQKDAPGRCWQRNLRCRSLQSSRRGAVLARHSRHDVADPRSAQCGDQPGEDHAGLGNPSVAAPGAARRFSTTGPARSVLCNAMQACLVCSEDDASHLRAMGVTGRLAVVPNGVDLDYFRAGAELAAAPRLAFVGTLDYDPCERGLWYFCNEILPKIRAKLPGATFTAIGRNPSRRLLDLAGPERGIEFTGRVEDLRPHVQGCPGVRRAPAEWQRHASQDPGSHGHGCARRVHHHRRGGNRRRRR